jgi:ABC-2 type transport system permease protein
MLWQYIKDDQLTVYKVAVPATMSQIQNSDSFEFIASNDPLKQLKKQLAQEDSWDAVLSETPSTNSVKQITIYSKDKQSWLGELKQTINQQYIIQYASSLGLAEEQLNFLNQSSIFENKYLDESIKSDNSPAKATAIAMIVILAIGIFTSFGQLFVNVTGEKQQRVTEQLYACISAQTWIDGKILGQMLHSIKAMITIVITGMLGYAFVTVIIKGGIIDFSMIDWSLMPWLIPFALTGVTFVLPLWQQLRQRLTIRTIAQKQV